MKPGTRFVKPGFQERNHFISCNYVMWLHFVFCLITKTLRWSIEVTDLVLQVNRNSEEMVDESCDDFSDRKFNTEIYYTCFRISKRFHKISKNNMRTLWSAELERTEMPFIRRCTVYTIQRSQKHLQQTENLFFFI